MVRWIPLLLLWIPTQVAAVVVDRLAAVVDGHVVTDSEVSELVESRRGIDSRPVEELRDRALELLIERVLVAREAERLGIRVADGEVESAVADIRGRNGLDEASFRSALANQGMDWETYLAEVRTQILQAKVAGSVLRPKLKVTDGALQEYYLKNVADYREPEAVRLCHIQLPAPEGMETAEAVRARALAGEDVSELAREVSHGPGAEAGGDMGYLPLQNLAEEVRHAVEGLSEGEVSPVVQMGGACHIFAILDKREGRIPAFEEVRDKIRETYLRSKEAELYKAWLESLKTKARIERKI